MNKYLDWSFRSTSWLTVVVAMVCLVCAFILPDTFGDKNSPLETVQMLIVLVGLFLSCTAKDQDRKVLYVFVSLCLFFVLAREVNYGRTLIFFADPENINKYPKWKDMEYGWIAHACVGLYLTWILVYFIWRKVWREIKTSLVTYRFPACELLFAIVGLIVGVSSESLHYCLIEELGEIVMYMGAVGIIYRYSRKKVAIK